MVITIIIIAIPGRTPLFIPADNSCKTKLTKQSRLLTYKASITPDVRLRLITQIVNLNSIILIIMHNGKVGNEWP